MEKSRLLLGAFSRQVESVLSRIGAETIRAMALLDPILDSQRLSIKAKCVQPPILISQSTRISIDTLRILCR